MQVAELVRRFLRWCEPRRAASTVKHYRSRLRKLTTALGDRELNEISPLELQEFLDTANTDMAPDTQRANIILLERLQRWAVEMRLLEQPILTRIEKPRGRRRERIPTDDEISKIHNAAGKPFRLVYSALRFTGARPNEICRATVADIDQATNAIVLKDHKTAKKTGKARVIPIGANLQTVITESLGDRTEGHLFLTARGKPWTPNTLGAEFRRLRRQLSLADDLVIYLARHEFATRVVRKLGIYAASQALGHADIKTTQRYSHFELDDIRNAQEAAFAEDSDE